jgi:hypothetical protein
MRKVSMIYPLVFAFAFVIGICQLEAKIYFLDDFEDFAKGSPIPGNSKLWVHNNSNATLDATATTEKSIPPGGTSIRFDNPKGGTWPDVQSIGLKFDPLDLPDKFVFSCYYWHWAKDNPPPDFMFCLVGAFGWLGLGTRGEDVHGAGGGVAEDVTQYVYRDKTGDSLYHSTIIPRKSDWANLAFIIDAKGTDCLIDGKKVYSSTVNSSTAVECFMGTMWNPPKTPVFVDHVVISDTLEEAELNVAVESAGKMASMWGHIKSVD